MRSGERRDELVMFDGLLSLRMMCLEPHAGQTLDDVSMNFTSASRRIIVQLGVLINPKGGLTCW